jgi:hypothetical protein
MPQFPGTRVVPKLTAAPASPTAGQVYYDTGTNTLYVWNGTLWVPAGAGAELGYDQITAGVNPTGTTAATATTVISCAAHSFDGAPVLCEFYAWAAVMGAVSGQTVTAGLFEPAGTLITALCTVVNNAAAALRVPFGGKFRFTPSAGSHTYTIAAWVSASGPNIAAGTGAGGGNTPAYCRFTKV